MPRICTLSLRAKSRSLRCFAQALIALFALICAGRSLCAQEPDWTMPRIHSGDADEIISEDAPVVNSALEFEESSATPAAEWTTNVPPQSQQSMQHSMFSPGSQPPPNFAQSENQNAQQFDRDERLAMQTQFDQSVNGENGAMENSPPDWNSGAPRPDGRGYYWQAPSWQFLPDGIIYKSYLAGPKEPRFASAWLNQSDHGWIWDISLGGRMGIVRYGTPGAVRPQGWQLDVEGAAFPRLDVEDSENLLSSDFRFGVPLTWSVGQWQTKFGYYHISSHVGDEFLLANPTFNRVNYVRDSILFGVGYFATESLRLYGETAWAFHHSVADPWEFQFGFEYSPPIINGRRGAPFIAANAQLFEEQDFGGGLNVMAGWQWRSEISNRLLRAGLQYFNGKSSQFSFYNESEQLVGIGIWLDQ